MKNSEFLQHISTKYNTELEAVRKLVLHMGGLIQQQMREAMQAMLSNNHQLAQSVIANDHLVNGYEVKIDHECAKILAIRQPTAGDLRLVVAVIKTITDMERIGDQATRIAHFALDNSLNHAPQSDFYLKLNHLFERVSSGLDEALESFARLDAEQALEVVKLDISVDDEYEALMRQLSTYMMEDPRTITQVLNVMWIARALERIGDHSKNIGEYVIYLIKGKDVRHISLDEKEQAVRVPVL